MDLDKIKNKIRKLMALSASDNEAEATLAMEKCQELMNRYNIKTIDVDPIGKTADISSEEIGVMCSEQWEKRLAIAVSAVFDNKVLFLKPSGRSRKYTSFRFFGGASDVNLVADLFKDLRRTVSIKGSLFAAKNKTIRGNYCNGMVTSIRHNLEKVYVSSTVEERGLMVIKEDSIHKLMSNLYPDIVKKNFSLKELGEGYINGIKDGLKIGVIRDRVQ